MKKITMTLGETIKKYRKRKGLNQTELANLIGLDRSAISNFENGKREPTYSMILKLAEVLNVDLIEFLNTNNYKKLEQFMKLNVYSNLIEKDWDKSLRKDINEMLDNLNNDGLYIIYTILKAFDNDDNFNQNNNTEDELKESQEYEEI